MRRDFQLPEHDVEYLDSLGLAWDAIQEGKTQWVVINNWKVPAGYRQPEANVALKIEPNYPDTQIDMAYFCPPLELVSGSRIPQTQSTADIAGQKFQRWSRHRSGNNPWRLGIDYIGTHMAQVTHWVQMAARNGRPR